MKNFLNGSFVGAIIGALVGALVAGIITTNVYKRQHLETQYMQFINELDRAVVYSSLLKSGELDKTFKTDMELSLNKAWAKAFVLLPDDDFKEIDKVFTRDQITKEARNKIYYNLRKKLYPKTKIRYDDYMTRLIRIKE